MKELRIFFIVTVSLLYFGSCGPERGREPVQKAFFDIDSFFRDQEETLRTGNHILVKTAGLDGNHETDTLRNPKWKGELRIFAECDLNKPGWQKSYRRDTLITELYQKLSYTALEPKLKIRHLQIILEPDGKVRQINVVQESDNFVFSTRKELEYKTLKSYKVSGYQKTIMLNPEEFEISGEILD